VAFFRQVTGHRAAHHAEAEECAGRHEIRPL
jgi:hypothetical protein